MLVILIIFLVSLFFLTRIIFIMAGLYKTPVIKSFEIYGPEETIYYPIPELMLWLGVFILTGTPWLAVYIGYHDPLSIPGVLLIGAWWYARQHPNLPRRYPFLTFLPRWYSDLRERTNRYERRRIAYMWLRLSQRTRWLFHTHDAAFLHWADFVIMGWVGDEESMEGL